MEFGEGLRFGRATDDLRSVLANARRNSLKRDAVSEARASNAPSNALRLSGAEGVRCSRGLDGLLPIELHAAGLFEELWLLLVAMRV